MSLTAWGGWLGRAWAFMTWRRKNLKDAFVAGFDLATFAGSFEMISRAACSDGGSFTWRLRPSAATISAAPRPDSNMVAKTFFPDGAGNLAGFDEFHHSASAAGETGLAFNFLAGIFQARRSSVCIQLAAALPGAPALTTASE